MTDHAALVHVPLRAADPDATETAVELRRLPDGSVVVPAYAERERLVECCGDAQPWMLIPLARLAALRAVLGFDAVALDHDLPWSERRTTGAGGGG